ncbi:MAG: DUF4396 domain-containing protein [Burkholderiales bacterium]
MFIQPIDYFLAAWFILAGVSALYVAIDQYRNNPEPVVMKWGFIMVTLYMGPLGLLLYVLADKEPRPGEHEEFIRPLWKQGVGSTIHCVAGDATGIILAAAITAVLGLPMWIDFIVEYIVGFSFGLFIFQSLFMKSMMGGTYWENVKKSFVPELVSMNFMMAAMAPIMGFLMMGRDMRAMDPAELVFWGVMSLGVMAGFAFAYPWNVWLVAHKLKHGLMTVRNSPKAIDVKHGVHGDPAADHGIDKAAISVWNNAAQCPPLHCRNSRLRRGVQPEEAGPAGKALALRQRTGMTVSTIALLLPSFAMKAAPQRTSFARSFRPMPA